MAGRRTVRVVRIYDDPSPQDGNRVLVDRIWPRGMSKDKARIDEWCKDVAPSTQLRTWYAHDPQRFPEFRRRYRGELTTSDAATALEHLRDLASKGTLTLLTATKDVEISAAEVLADVLGEKRPRRSTARRAGESPP
jgi:uncharacterized protein YeaO (DUF488 family)